MKLTSGADVVSDGARRLAYHKIDSLVEDALANRERSAAEHHVCCTQRLDVVGPNWTVTATTLIRVLMMVRCAHGKSLAAVQCARVRFAWGPEKEIVDLPCEFGSKFVVFNH